MSGDIDELLNGNDKQCGLDSNVMYMPRNECYQLRYNFKQTVNDKFERIEEKQEKRDEKIDKKLDDIYKKQDSINNRLLGIFASVIAGIVIAVVIYVLP